MRAACIRRRRVRAVACLLLPCLIGTMGCSQQPQSARGRVSLDGQPLSEALIMFVPLEAGAKQTGGSVENGEFEIAVDVGLFPGKYRVEIIDNPPIDHRPAHEIEAAMRSRRVLPRRYGQNSPFTIEIGGEQTPDLQQLNFDLNTRAAPGS